MDPIDWLSVCRGAEAARAWLLSFVDVAQSGEIVSQYPVLSVPEFPRVIESLRPSSSDVEFEFRLAANRLRGVMERLKSDAADAYADLVTRCAIELLHENEGELKWNAAHSTILFQAARSCFDPTAVESAECMMREATGLLRFAELSTAEAALELRRPGNNILECVEVARALVQEARLHPRITDAHLPYCLGTEADAYVLSARLGVSSRTNLKAAISLYRRACAGFSEQSREATIYRTKERDARQALANLTPDFSELYAKQSKRTIFIAG